MTQHKFEPVPATSSPGCPHRVITRHPGAADWVRRQISHAVDVVPHLEPGEIEAGVHYYGVFPLHLAAAICEQGAACWAISVNMPPALRGQELSAQQLDELGAILVRYDVQALKPFERPTSARRAQAGLS